MTAPITGDGWVGGFERVLIRNRLAPRVAQLGRPHLQRVRKIVVHTIEGTNLDGAVATYRARAGAWTGGVHPHFTVSPRTGRKMQHVPLSRASYALKGGDQGGVIQVELEGYADRSHTWPTAWLEWVGREVLAPIVAYHPGIPLEAPAPFLGAEAGLLALPWPRGRARLSPSVWEAVGGILGHQHSPPDDHWDPGRLDVAPMIAATARALVVPELEDEPMRTVVDTETSEAWVVDNGKARKIGVVDSWLASFTGPVIRAKGMRHVVADLYSVVA